MKTLVRKFLSHLWRRGETGQSMVLLALGFIGLAGFVGITVDVSLLFVRYAQLSRSVDSAAIAAANQMRQDKSMATVGLAARQFIEFHGLNPETVWVDTCQTMPGDPELCTADQAKLVRVRAFVKVDTVFLKLLGIRSFDLVAAAVSQTAALDVVLIMDVSESMLSDTSYMDWAMVEEIGVDPDTRTRRNWGVIYRPPNATEILMNMGLTADQANLNMTNFWEGGSTVNLTSDGTPGGTVLRSNVKTLLLWPQADVNNRLVYRQVNTGSPGTLGPYDAGAPSGSPPRDNAYKVMFNSTYFTDANFPGMGFGSAAASHPREACRVRFYPNAQSSTPIRYSGYEKTDGSVVTLDKIYLGGGSGVPTSYFTWTTGGTGAASNFNTFVPTYLFYDCCNDPDNDGSFEDLTCQPFKEARDATFEFLKRIDFLRGDRAAFVTFDRSAFLINPYGVDASGNGLGAMLDNWTAAFITLRDLIGVRAEPNFYVWQVGNDPNNLSSGWRQDVLAAGINSDGSSIPINYNDTTYVPGSGTQPLDYWYPVYDACPFSNASVRADRSLFDNGLQNISLPNELPKPGGAGYTTDSRDPAWGNFQGGIDSSTLLIQPAQRNQPAGNRSTYNSMYSYDYWGSCRNGNVGAALREANNALLNPTTIRRFGTIWVIVLLSDGAAGGSDPVRRNGSKIPTSNPYQKVGTVFGAPGDYGAFGLCPTGTPTRPGELMTIGNDITSGTSAGKSSAFPRCSDESPRTRYTCDFRPLRTLRDHPEYDAKALRDLDYKEAGAAGGPPAGSNPYEVESWNRRRGNLYDVDIDLVAGGGFGGCDPLYDVDDYAHDWADFIGLQDLAGSSNAQLPTIFTIGFGLGFTVTTDAGGSSLLFDPSKPLTDPVNAQSAQTNARILCERNAANCQGEQLLRYIADIGDNNQLDNDYWQDTMESWYDFALSPGSTLFRDGHMDPGSSFGRRDACQTQDEGPNSSGTYDYNNNGTVDLGAEEDAMWGALAPNRSCGNYYYAPGGEELQFVFDDIASRMFTRLSR